MTMTCVFAKYNRERLIQYQTETVIFKSDDKLYVKKKALSKQAEKHITQIYENYLSLRNYYKTAIVVEAFKEPENNTVIFDYVNGESFNLELMKAVISNDQNSFFEILRNYKAFLDELDIIEVKKFIPCDEFIKVFGGSFDFNENIKCFKITNIDLTFENIIRNTKGIFTIIDYEWVFKLSVPVAFIIYRSIKEFFAANSGILSKFIPIEEAFKYFNISKQEVEIYNQMEENFQRYIFGGENIYRIKDKYIKNSQSLTEILSKLEQYEYNINTQNARIEELLKWGQTLDSEILSKDYLIRSQNEEIEDLSRWGQALDFEIEIKNNLIKSQNKQIEELSKLEQTLQNKNNFIELQNQKIDALSKREQALDIDIQTRDKLIKSQNEMIEELYDKEKLHLNELNDAKQTILNKHGHIEQLLEQERILNKIYTSRGWCLLLCLYRITDIVIPHKSRRRAVLKAIYKILKNITKVVKSINADNIKKLLKYIKTYGLYRALEKVLFYAERQVSIKKKEIRLYSTNNYEKIEFKKEKDPVVSIVIPVYNNWDYTYSCLKAIFCNTEEVPYEIIIGDDLSTDETKNIKEFISNVVTVRNKKNLGFLLNCNNAAKHSKGKYIHFLNNDTNVQSGWLKSLVDLIESDKNIGMVGSKLIYPDGRLQEAGGIIWKDASGWNYGHLDDPEKAEYNYIKEVDYISGASILIRKELWAQIGGFDERFIPAYFEDTDLSFEVRKRGYKVLYQPKSVVVHFEGISHGTDENSGIKTYQVKNREKFIDKWREKLESEQFENGQELFCARDRSRSKQTILVIDHYVPHHDKDAGGKCTYLYIKLFIKLGLKVTFIGDNFFPHEPYTSELQQMGVEVLYGNYYYANWKKWLKENGQYFHYVYLNRPHISSKYIDLVREYSRAKIIYFGHDLHYVREHRRYELTGDKKLLEASEEWKQKEFELFEKADVIHVVGSYEESVLAKEFPDKPIRNIPVYFYDEMKSKDPILFSERKDLIFVGGFGHSPNIDAVLWFAQEIYPKILKKYSDIKWYIIGSNPTQEVLNLACENIIVLGFVSDEKLAELYGSCRMSVVPLRYGAGVKGKVIESVYNRIPLITTSIGAEGISVEENAFIVADTADDFAEQVIDSYNDLGKLEKLSNNCIEFIENNFTTKIAQQIIRMDIIT